MHASLSGTVLKRILAPLANVRLSRDIVLQCVAVCCSVLQCVLQRMLQCVSPTCDCQENEKRSSSFISYIELQCVAVCVAACVAHVRVSREC